MPADCKPRVIPSKKADFIGLEQKYIGSVSATTTPKLTQSERETIRTGRAWDFRPNNFAPNYFLIHKGMHFDRYVVCKFLEKVGWATSRNISSLLGLDIKATSAGLAAMLRRKKDPLRKLPCSKATCYGHPKTGPKRVSPTYFEHDEKLRTCIAKFVQLYGYDLLDRLELRQDADAKIGNVYIEFDNGNQGKPFLKEKLLKHYAKPGNYRVVFFMGAYNKAHWRKAEQTARDEDSRIAVLRGAIAETIHQKPNRVLIAGYTQFLSSGKLFNYRGELREPF